MRRLREDPPQHQPAAERPVVPVDPVNEVAIVAAAIHDTSVLDRLLKQLTPGQFMVRENREAWAVLGEVRRKGLQVDRASVVALGGEHVADYLASIAALAQPPSAENVDWHVKNLVWDNLRAHVARGPAREFLEALRDPRTDHDKVVGFARQIGAAFAGHSHQRFIHDPRELVREAMVDVERRVSGHAHYPYGIPGLDYFDPERRDRKRMLPGSAPGMLTCLTGNSGNGKSLTAAWMAIGIAFPGGVESDVPGRRVGYGAWEMQSRMTLEILATLTLGWSRTGMMDPHGVAHAPILTHEGRVQLEERMHRLAQRIVFCSSPFKRKPGEKASNDRNLDIMQGLISDMNVEVFIADLYRRLIAGDRGRTPEAEEDALERQQSMNEELRVHLIALAQQRIADTEKRGNDPRPSREGVKGSKAWVESPDAFIGMYRPGLYKRGIPDERIQALILKQRYGVWPLAVEFDFDPERGRIAGGMDIPYDSPGEESSFDADIAIDRRPPIRRRR